MLQSKVRKIATGTQQTRVYEELADALLTGRFAPNEPISVKALCDAIGAGTMPVRESIQRLVGVGALSLEPNKTARVPKYSRAEFDELYAIRSSLEQMAVAGAARNITPEELAEVERLNARLAQVENGPDLDATLRTNFEFHFAIYRGAHSPHLLKVIESLWLRMGPLFRVPFLGDPARREEFVLCKDQHGALIRALQQRSPDEAQRVLRGMLECSASWYRRYYDFDAD